jgi:thiopeptide-type bacteriocin biosynthesis protein
MIYDATWRSMHVFIGSDDDVRPILSLVRALLKERHGRRSSDWFFIRYWEGGPHVRIRLGSDCCPSFDRLRASLLDWAREHIPADPPSDPRTHPTPDGLIFGPGEVREILYEPEFVRYGGEASMLVNEDLFRISTALTVELLSSGRSPAAVALDMMLVVAAVIFDEWEEAKAYFAAYAASWERFFVMPSDAAKPVGAFAARFAEHRSRRGVPAAGVASRWRTALEEAVERFRQLGREGSLVDPYTGSPIDPALTARAVADMFASQMHMNNNRLGYLPPQELLWARSLAVS